MVRRATGSVTPADLRVLEFLEGFERERGRPASLREVAEAMDWRSHGTAQRHINALIAAGRLRRRDQGPRPLELAGSATTAPRRVPVIDRVLPGQPLTAGATHFIYEPTPFGEGTFAMVVEDDAMRPGGIARGAIAFAVPKEAVESGQVVVARVEGATAAELVVRRYHERPRGPVLDADVREYPRLRVGSSRGQEVRVEGVVVACLTVVR